MFHIKVQNECGMCVYMCVCVSVGVCAISGPVSELSTLLGNSTWSFRPLLLSLLLSFMRYLCMFPNLDSLVRQQRCLSNTDLTALTSTATSTATATAAFAFFFRISHGERVASVTTPLTQSMLSFVVVLVVVWRCQEAFIDSLITKVF